MRKRREFFSYKKQRKLHNFFEETIKQVMSEEPTVRGITRKKFEQQQQQQDAKQNDDEAHKWTLATKSSLLIGDTPVDTYIQNLFGELVKATRVSNTLPGQESFSFFRASNQQFNDLMAKHAHQLQRFVHSHFL